MMSPPTIAPGMESKPPRISTGSAFSATNVSANWTPLRAPQSSPATSATAPATAHTIAQICCNGMPTASAAWWSSATARNARPIRVRLKNSASTVTRSAATPAATRSNFETFIPVVSVSHWIGSSCRPSSRPRTLAPHTSCARPSMKNARPIVAMNSVICGWLTSGRSTMRSVTSPSTIITTSVAGMASHGDRPCSSRPT